MSTPDSLLSTKTTLNNFFSSPRFCYITGRIHSAWAKESHFPDGKEKDKTETKKWNFLFSNIVLDNTSLTLILTLEVQGWDWIRDTMSLRDGVQFSDVKMDLS